MDQSGEATFEAFDTDSVLHHLSPWEVALTAVSKLAVVFALSLSLILILGHQMAGPLERPSRPPAGRRRPLCEAKGRKFLRFASQTSKSFTERHPDRAL